MNAKMQANMNELNRRIADAVARTVATGVDQKEAFRRHMECLAAEYPSLFAAYCKWLSAPR